MLQSEDLVKYPFLKRAAESVGKYDVGLFEITEAAYPGVIRRAVDRVKQSLEKKPAATNFEDTDSEVLSYPLAIAMVYGSKEMWIINRFAVTEQKRVEMHLKSEDKTKLQEIAKNAFDWELVQVQLVVDEAKFDYRLGMAEFLDVAPTFQSDNWKLVNRYVSDGFVYLRQGEVARLISEKVKRGIITKAGERAIKNFELPEGLKPCLKEILDFAQGKKEAYEDEAPIGVVPTAFPPCIGAITRDLAEGKSISHMARFTLTTFLITAGENVDNVLASFKNVADFDEGKARYQIEHIAGMSGSRTKYSPPKCDVLRSFGLCIGKDDFCDGRHPMNSYKNRITGRRRIQGKREGRKSAPNRFR